MVREIFENELDELLHLYLHLHETSVPEFTEHLKETWNTILGDRNYHVIAKEIDGRIVASCVCLIVPNLARNVRPYALVENVVTDKAFRGRGYATECLNYAKRLAKDANCYKIMLLTGAKDQKTLHFYRNAGYNSEDKTAFVQWLEP